MSPDGGRRLPRQRRIVNGAEIRALLARGKRSGTADLDVFDSTSPAAFARVGLIVPKHRHRIVERNLVKRRVREILRLDVLPRLDESGLASDVMVRAKRTAYDATYDQLRQQLLRWVEKKCSRASSSA